ncbi:MAG TPA: dihydroneopterin triphosphate 2'-epimerase [Nitrococcus sp.]|nr:dihydroneopterin triphosphate 2'-epimerase [Nitrococcus sp.]
MARRDITLDHSQIHIKNLRLRTYIGLNADEQTKLQDVVIGIWVDYDARAAASQDAVEHALNYKAITKQVIALVENNRFLLLEKLVFDVLDLVLAFDGVKRAIVEVDKPHALRFADSVSLSMAASRR